MRGLLGFQYGVENVTRFGLNGFQIGFESYLIIKAIGPANEFVQVEVQGNDGSITQLLTDARGFCLLSNRTFTTATILIKTVESTYSFQYDEVTNPNQLINCEYQGAFIIFTSPYQFLSTKPQTRLLSTQHPEYLYILQILAFRDPVLKALIRYTDGNTASKDLKVLDLELHRVLVVDISYAMMQYQSVDPTKMIASIEIEITSPDLNQNQVDKLIYVPFTANSDTTKAIYYRNFYGGLDTLICTGDDQQSETYDAVASEEFQGLNHALDNPQRGVNNTSFEEVVSINSGYKPKREIESLSDLFTIKSAFEYRSELLNPFVKIIPIKQENTYASEKENVAAVQFSYEYAYIQKAKDRR